MKLIAKRYYCYEYEQMIESLKRLKRFYYNEYDLVLPKIVFELLIIAEDKRFYQHYGIDFLAMSNAFCHNIWHRSKRGASTVEQQLVRIIRAKYEYTYKRKVKEILLATVVDEILTKLEIINIYLMIAYFGNQMYGISYLLEKYNVNLDELTSLEIAKIIARLKYPDYRNRNIKRENAIMDRAKYILKIYDKG